MRLTVKREVDAQILYLLRIYEVDGKDICKIGITSRKIEDRVVEILTSYFHAYRVFPKLYPKRFRKVKDAFMKEQWLLDYLKEYKYTIDKKFSGCTELVDIDLDILVDLYEKVLNGEEMIVDQWESCPVCGKDKKFSVEVDGKEVKTCGNKCEIKEEEDENRGEREN